MVLGLLIFGRRLPEVGKSLGRSIVEFKRGVKGITDEIDAESSHTASSPAQLSEKQGASAPTLSADDVRRMVRVTQHVLRESTGALPRSERRAA